MATAPSLVCFGPFELDLSSGELRREGMKIRLGGQPLHILTLLVEHPGKTVTRQELREHLWSSENTFVDFEHSLNAAVKRLREALCDSAENPRYIETLPRHGYRFIAPVSCPGSFANEPKPPARAVLPPRRFRFVSAATLAVMLAIAATALMSGMLVQNTYRGALSRASPAQQPIRAIAVLPIVNLSNDPKQEYFTDSMTEALITELGRTHGVRVISRQSVVQYKGTSKPVSQIATELGVDALVEGSALREGDTVRITVQFIRARPEEHLWASSYERRTSGILMQGEVARAIVSEINGHLKP